MAASSASPAGDATPVTDAAAGASSTAALRFERVCSLSEVPPGRTRLARLASGRGVLLVRDPRIAGTTSPPRIYCLDHACYHHGGPLADGAIAEYGGVLCVKCPWHSYQVALETGEGLYYQLDFAGPKGPDGKPRQVLASKGVKQRTHPVRVEGSDVFVADSGGPNSKPPDASDDGGAAPSAAGAGAGADTGAAGSSGANLRPKVDVESDTYAFSEFTPSVDVEGGLAPASGSGRRSGEVMIHSRKKGGR